MLEHGTQSREEWTSEGERNRVCKPERKLRYQIQHINGMRRVDGRIPIKPGGTAGVYRSCPCMKMQGQGRFYVIGNSIGFPIT